MNHPSWTDVITAIATGIYTLVTGLGLFFIWKQVRLGNRQVRLAIRQVRMTLLSARTTTIAELYIQQNTLNMFFFANHNLRPFFYGNRAIETADEAELPRIMIIAEMVSDFMEHVFVQLPNLTRDLRDAWTDYIRYLYKHSPAIQQHFIRNGEWYSQELRNLLGHTEG
jgi:hypothetical protein